MTSSDARRYTQNTQRYYIDARSRRVRRLMPQNPSLCEPAGTNPTPTITPQPSKPNLNPSKPNPKLSKLEKKHATPVQHKEKNFHQKKEKVNFCLSECSPGFKSRLKLKPGAFANAEQPQKEVNFLSLLPICSVCQKSSVF